MADLNKIAETAIGIKDVGNLLYGERMNVNNGEGMTLQDAKDRPILYWLDCWRAEMGCWYIFYIVYDKYY